MKQQLENLLQQAIQSLQADGVLAADISPKISLDRTKSKEHGDLASNLALTLAKAAKMPPRDIAAKIITAIPDNNIIRECEIAGPGFINFFFNEAAATAVINTIFTE